MERAEGLLKAVATAIAAVVPVILLAGYSYHLGYTLTFGLSEDLVFKSMSEVLVESWYVAVISLGWLLSKWYYLLIAIALLYIMLVFFFFWARRQKQKEEFWLFQEITKENQGRNIFGVSQWHWVCLGETFHDLFSWFYYPMLVLAAIGLLTAHPFTLGKNLAIEQIELFKQKGCETTNEKISCIELVEINQQNETFLIQGILVSANESRIAIYNDGLEIWPLLDSYLIKDKRLDLKSAEAE